MVQRRSTGEVSVEIEKAIDHIGDELSATDKYAIVRSIHETHRTEISFHREVMNKTTQWATGVYLAIAGGLLLIGSDGWRELGVSGKFLVTVVLALVTTFVVSQLLHSSSAINSNAQIVVKADTALLLFRPNEYIQGEQLYPEKWKQWGTSKGAGYYDLFHIAVTILLALSVGAFAFLL
jgi:hypothetical protein